MRPLQRGRDVRSLTAAANLRYQGANDTIASRLATMLKRLDDDRPMTTKNPAGGTRHVQQSVPRAVGLLLLALTFFAALDATAKYLLLYSGLPVTQIVWVRFLGQLAAIVVVLGLVSLPKLLRSAKPSHQLARSVFLLGSTAFNFLALRHLRLDQTTTISFLGPLVVALLAGPFLGEWVGWRRLVAILVGFCGVLIAVRPGVGTFEPAFLFAFAGVASYACFTLLTRYLAPHDSSETTLFYSLLVGAIAVAPFALMDWVTPTGATTILLMVALGLFGGAGHFVFIVAFRYAPAPVIVPFTYFSLITYAGAGWLVFDQLPDAWTLAGAGVIIASGLYIIWREQVRAREARIAAAFDKMGGKQ